MEVGGEENEAGEWRSACFFSIRRVPVLLLHVTCNQPISPDTLPLQLTRACELSGSPVPPSAYLSVLQSMERDGRVERFAITPARKVVEEMVKSHVPLPVGIVNKVRVKSRTRKSHTNPHPPLTPFPFFSSSPK